MADGVLVVHGGAPTAVINASLYGVMAQAEADGFAGRLLAAKGGAGGILRGKFIDLAAVPAAQRDRLPHTPASAIGTSREHLTKEDYARMADILNAQGIGLVLFNGGNGSMDAAGRLQEASGGSIRVVGIPKTIDNDIAVTDHAPGYASAARYLAQTVREICEDVRSLPIHVCVVEAMGRNTGWLTAASALARTQAGGPGPHMLCLPEKPFDEDAFLAEIERLHLRHGGVVVVASEGLRNKDGSTIVPPIFKVGRSEYYGDVSAHLAGLVIQKLGIKARSEKPGIAGRCSAMCQSAVDREEATLAGREAFKAGMAGQSGVMVGFERLPGPAYAVRPILIPIKDVMLHERTMPEEFINEAGTGVTPAFMDWCAPLLGGAPTPFAHIG